jgi:ABC-type sugar transport system ATPase subunit
MEGTMTIETFQKDRVVMTAKQITKIFPGTRALQEVDFTVYGGKINVLVGENGAGKSTLMKILAGIEHPTSGEMFLYDEEETPLRVSFANTRDAAKKGIGIVHQELNLFSDLTVSENIFMNKEIKRYGSLYINHEQQSAKAREILHKLGQDIDPNTLIRNLRLGQQQIVEIAKTMVDEPKILIMDEPTSSLSVQEVEVLFSVIKELKEEGVGIIYISHRMEEIKLIGDYITILRDARLVESCKMNEIGMNEIIKKMVGRDPKKFFSGQTHNAGKEILRVEHITLPRFGGGYTLEDVSFSVRQGEILGIYGLMGAGRTELLESMMGVVDVKDRIAHGLVLIPEERQREGLFLNLAVDQNLTMASIHRYAKALKINEKTERKFVGQMIKEMRIKVATPQISINALSGGNQQKVVIGKCLLTDPKVLLMDEPTRGIDVGAKSEVFEIMNTMANNKFGIVFVSSELEEILSMSDRILVLSKGKITGEFIRSEATEEVLRRASEIGHGITVTTNNREVVETYGN